MVRTQKGTYVLSCMSRYKGKSLVEESRLGEIVNEGKPSIYDD